MPSKRFSGHMCVYCGQQPSTTTGDHLFARQFFLERDRANLPKVPGCLSCGNRKSKLEHYLTTVLPFAGKHASNSETLNALVPGRLAKNRKLARELSAGLESQTELQPMMLPFDGNVATDLFKMICRGLLWFHWGVYLPDSHDVDCVWLTETGEEFFDRLFEMRSGRRVDLEVGYGAFRYLGAQSEADPYFSIWRVQIYGGAQMAGGGDQAGQRPSSIGCLTASRETLASNPLT